jgi:anti-sigma regulatory factor (Ser/Thr protein kinase)
MHVSELIDIALAGVDSSRVDVELLEPAALATEAVSALSQVVAELVENATAFSAPDQRIRINGLFEDDGYLISISDDGVGISESMLAALNRILERPSPSSGDNEVTLGITLVARLAARHQIGVRLVPGVPGTTARVTVPSRLVSPGAPVREPRKPREHVESPIDDVFADAPQESTAPSPYERDFRPAWRHVVSMSEQGRDAAETFLDSVFAPLRSRAISRDRPLPRRRDNGVRETRDEPRPPTEPEPLARTSTLQVRVPGANFSVEEDEPSIVSSEAAVDLKSALTRFELGRKDARESGDKGQQSFPAGS